MTEVKLLQRVGPFAENKETARTLRVGTVIPALESGDTVVIDFTGVNDATQSFVHALISDLFRKFGAEVLDRVSFKGCNETVRNMIGIVSDYMQESL